jgi:hypothetical protein
LRLYVASCSSAHSPYPLRSGWKENILPTYLFQKSQCMKQCICSWFCHCCCWLCM